MVSSKSILSVVTAFQVILSLDASFIAIPNTASPVNVALRSELVLNCEANNEPDQVNFQDWYRDNEKLVITRTNRYSVEKGENSVILRVSDYGAENDRNVTTWSVKANDKIACLFPSESIILVPSPQSISTDRPDEKITTDGYSIRRFLGESVRIKCELEPATALQNVTWEFSEKQTNFHELRDHVVVDGNEIFIEKIAQRDRGNFRCGFNGAYFTVNLRAKDKYGALWPSLGIFLLVLFLIVIILVYEKLSKTKRKAGRTTDKNAPQDQADDPLVAKSKIENKENFVQA